MANGSKILRGLRQAVSHAKGQSAGAREYVVRVPNEIDVRAIRAKLGLTQEAFALQFGVSLGTVRHWEQGSRFPDGPARVLLTVIDKEPEVVKRVLAG
ncbi:MAG: helix-turn-helix domain-containing protein [Reyranella sp.]|nr:helix-turn-helix domain-containing protein [Reyranella sp.]MBY0324787.1 helix-turn-helix domain-containing protein [Reyranella sp.]